MAGQSANRRSKREFRGTGVYVSFVLALALAVLILIGIIQNTQSVMLSYLVWTVSTPLIVILLVTIVASVVLSALVGVIWRRRRRNELTLREELRMLRGAAAVSETPSTGAPEHLQDTSLQVASPPIVTQNQDEDSPVT